MENYLSKIIRRSTAPTNTRSMVPVFRQGSTIREDWPIGAEASQSEPETMEEYGKDQQDIAKKRATTVEPGKIPNKSLDFDTKTPDLKKNNLSILAPHEPEEVEPKLKMKADSDKELPLLTKKRLSPERKKISISEKYLEQSKLVIKDKIESKPSASVPSSNKKIEPKKKKESRPTSSFNTIHTRAVRWAERDKRSDVGNHPPKEVIETNGASNSVMFQTDISSVPPLARKPKSNHQDKQKKLVPESKKSTRNATQSLVSSVQEKVNIQSSKKPNGQYLERVTYRKTEAPLANAGRKRTQSLLPQKPKIVGALKKPAIKPQLVIGKLIVEVIRPPKKENIKPPVPKQRAASPSGASQSRTRRSVGLKIQFGLGQL